MRYLRSLSLLSLLALSSFALQVGTGLDIGLQRAWVDRWALEAPIASLNFPVFLTDEHGVQLSLRYSPKGWENDSGYGFETNWLHYVDIPLTYHFYPAFFPIQLGISLGINYSILIGASYARFEPFDTYKEYYKGTDYGLLFGVHYKKPVAFGSLLFSVEYYAGLQTIRENWEGSFGEIENRPVKNHAVSACLGYELPRMALGDWPRKPSKTEE
jgi:hypothetical protein